MIAFAGNSVLCRIALKHTSIDAASFTSIRLVSGAVVLWAIAGFFRKDSRGSGNWISAFALFAYAAGFSFAYISLTATIVQLSVPVFAALGGIILLGESVTARFLLASLAILGGIALVILSKSQRNGAQPGS